MARKVFISVLGTGLYERCKYVSGDFFSSNTTFIQLATLEYLQYKSDWSTDSVAYILLTDKARTDNWEVETKQRHDKNKGVNVPYIGLKETFKQASPPFPIEGISIPNGENESEMWEIFEKTYNLLEEGDELYFDQTHSFRYLPMLMLVLGNYAKFLKKATVCSITYGNYEARNRETNEAPIVDLLSLSSLQDWTFATADFLKNGYVDRLVELSNKSLNPLINPLMILDETQTADSKRLKSFVNNLKIFSLDMQTCRGLEILNAATIEKTKSDIKALNKVVIPQLEPVLHEVQKSIEPFNASNGVKNTFIAANWCYNNQFYQQATTFLEEGIISLFCQRHGIALNDRKKRELIPSAFIIKQLNKPKEEWKVSNPDWMELLEEIINDEILDKWISTFSSIAALRNDYNHCGMRDGASKSKDIKGKIRKRLDKTISLLDSSIHNNSPQKGSSYLINLSNHPSYLWGGKQKEAAKDYGEIKDFPFPAVSPDASYEDIQELANHYVEDILSITDKYHVTVHVMGEMTFTFMVVSQLKDNGIECIASTTERNAVESTDGRKISDFQFVQFRKY